MNRFLATIAAAAITTAAGTAVAQGVGSRRVTIEYQDLSGTQSVSTAPWVSHAPGFHMYEVGKPATLMLQELAENGNPEFMLATAVKDPGRFKDQAVGIFNLAGKGRTVTLTVDAAHPLVSGGWMLGLTNDGFTGIDSVDAFHLKKPMVIETYAYDAGTKANTETKEDTAALGGLGRHQGEGLVARHPGVRGDADIPVSAKFDPSKPIGRIVISPASPNS